MGSNPTAVATFFNIISRLKIRICVWYVDSDFLLLRFTYYHGSFSEDINKKYVLCKYADNGIKHIYIQRLYKRMNNERNKKIYVNEVNRLAAGDVFDFICAGNVLGK